ncbi:MAG: hypothetical protein Q7W29_00470 [bacterium]|nr:hypothetical protein [bacterium]
MRKSFFINTIMPQTRSRILGTTLLNPERWWYLSDLANHLQVRPSSLQRELSALVAAGILRRRRDGNRVYFQPDPGCPVFSELRGLMLKTVGLVDVLREALMPFSARISWAFVYGSLARGEESGSSDVDLMIIGDTGLAVLAVPLQKAEERLLRPINPTIYTQAEVANKLAAGHHFLREVMAREKLPVLGSLDELDAVVGDAPSPATRDEPSGD